MYAILKNANNVEEAERRIDEGKLIQKFFLKLTLYINKNITKFIKYKIFNYFKLAFTNSAFKLK